MLCSKSLSHPNIHHRGVIHFHKIPQYHRELGNQESQGLAEMLPLQHTLCSPHREINPHGHPLELCLYPRLPDQGWSKMWDQSRQTQFCSSKMGTLGQKRWGEAWVWGV